VKSILVEVDDELYYKLKEKMAQMHCSTWAEFLRKVVEDR